MFSVHPPSDGAIKEWSPFVERAEWLRVTLSSIGDAVMTTDISGCITFLNPVAETLTGWTQEEAAGRPLEEVFRIVNETSRSTVENPAIRALRDGVVVGLANHSLLISKDGTEHPIDDSASPIRNPQGAVAGVVLVFRDVTERRRHERDIRDALSYADNIIASLRHPFLVLDKSMRVVTANFAFYENFVVTAAETQGKFIYELGNGQWNIPMLRSMMEDVLPHHATIQDFEVEHVFPTIGRKCMVVDVCRIRQPGNNTVLILFAIEDVTEYRRAEGATRSSEARYRRLFESAKDGILILDVNTLRIIDANPFMMDLLDYSHDEFLGKELWELGLFGDKQASQTVYRELQEKGYVRYATLPLETKSGKRVEVEFISNVYQVDHRLVAQCNIRDISERSRLEQQMKEQATALADLHLRKDEFLAMLSHELRNPLAPIADAVHVLRDQKNQDQVQQHAHAIIERQVGQMTRLIDELLEVTRITTGRIHLHQQQVAVNVIVENAVETVRTLIEQRRHVLHVSLLPETIWLYADAARLEQVVVNLLINAAKYTDEEGQIWLSVEHQGNEAVLRIRDNGVGIPAELLPRIFDLFTQAERSLDRAQGGLGIGLCLVQRLVEMHCGQVEVNSTLGEGSEFVVRLPVMMSPAPAPPAAQGESAASTGPPLRVLIVDDNVDAANALAMRLELSGHQVRSVSDGAATVEAALDYRPDVVLLDIGLPGISGLEVARLLRRQEELNRIVLVAMTGYGQQADRQRSLEAGFDHHLVKPADAGKLRHILASVADKAKS